MSEIKLLSNTLEWGNRGIHFVFGKNTVGIWAEQV